MSTSTSILVILSQEIFFQVRQACAGVKGCNAGGCSWCDRYTDSGTCRACCCNGDGSCFPAVSKVYLENGKSVTMSELQIGDRVQTGISTLLLHVVLPDSSFSCFTLLIDLSEIQWFLLSCFTSLTYCIPRSFHWCFNLSYIWYSRVLLPGILHLTSLSSILSWVFQFFYLLTFDIQMTILSSFNSIASSIWLIFL